MRESKSGIRLTVLLLLAFAALITGVFVYQHLHAPKKIEVSQFNGTYLQKPRELAEFNLTGTDDTAFNAKSLKGQWTMLFFGFTNCDSICPTTMAELAKMYALLQHKHVQPLPHIVMVSVDPDRDSISTLKHYVHAFNPDFYGARGDEEVIKKLTGEMGIAYAKQMTDNAGHYDMQHSGTIMLINPQGQLTAFFTMPHHAEDLAKDYQLLLG